MPRPARRRADAPVPYVPAPRFESTAQCMRADLRASLWVELPHARWQSPDRKHTLSLALAELCSQSVTYARGGVATVFFSEGGFRLEISDSGPSSMRLPVPVLHSQLPRALTSLRAGAAGQGTVVIAEYERSESA